MNSFKVVVIAGTYVDTKMGADFLRSKGMDPFENPVAASSGEYELQLARPEELTVKINSMIKKIKSDGINRIMVYCNSLSSTVDFEVLAEKENVKIITPLTAYKHIAGNYKMFGAMAGNNQGLAGIERAITGVNPNAKVIGLAMLPLVMEIENGTPPEKIIEDFSLKKILEFYDAIYVEVIILGCTHFPYLYKELEKNTGIPILDPAELMYKMLVY